MAAHSVLLVTAALLLTFNPALTQLTCSSTLDSGFVKNRQINDADGDGFVTGLEIYNDFKNNYDKDGDGCVTVNEWVDRWQSYFLFSAGYANQRLVDVAHNVSAQCAIKYDAYRTMNLSIPIQPFMSGNVQSLINYCKSDASLTTTNCDCSQLQATCVSNSSSISTTEACIQMRVDATYGSVCSGKGWIGFRFQKNINVNDANGDGFVSGTEIYNDFKNNYDQNNDGCCSVKEWTDRWENFFKFSKAYAMKRLEDFIPDLSVACPISYGMYNNNDKINIPVDPFLQENLESLVKLCRSDNSLFQSNCDCLQLYNACVRDRLLSPGVICQTYLKNPVVTGP